MRTVSSDTLEQILGEPELRQQIAVAYPKPRCTCGAPATGIWAIAFEDNGVEPEPPWVEWRLGCAACYFHNFGKGQKSERPPIIYPYFDKKEQRFKVYRVFVPRRLWVELILPIGQPETAAIPRPTQTIFWCGRCNKTTNHPTKEHR